MENNESANQPIADCESPFFSEQPLFFTIRKESITLPSSSNRCISNGLNKNLSSVALDRSYHQSLIFKEENFSECEICSKLDPIFKGYRLERYVCIKAKYDPTDPYKYMAKICLTLLWLYRRQQVILHFYGVFFKIQKIKTMMKDSDIESIGIKLWILSHFSNKNKNFTYFNST